MLQLDTQSVVKCSSQTSGAGAIGNLE